MRRPPLPLAQDDTYGCGVYTTANILYAFHILDYPDVNWVNQRLGRQPGEDAWDASTTLLLLNQGLSAYSIDSFNSAAFSAYGIQYLRHFYSKYWNSQWEDFYTPEEIASTRARTLELEAEIAKRNLPYYTQQRPPTIDDIVYFVQVGCIVDLAIRDIGELASHAVLVYDFHIRAGEKLVNIHCSSSNKDDTIYEMPLEALAEDWDSYWIDAWWKA